MRVGLEKKLRAVIKKRLKILKSSKYIFFFIGLKHEHLYFYGNLLVNFNGFHTVVPSIVRNSFDLNNSRPASLQTAVKKNRTARC